MTTHNGKVQQRRAITLDEVRRLRRRRNVWQDAQRQYMMQHDDIRWRRCTTTYDDARQCMTTTYAYSDVMRWRTTMDDDI